MVAEHSAGCTGWTAARPPSFIPPSRLTAEGRWRRADVFRVVDGVRPLRRDEERRRRIRAAELLQACLAELRRGEEAVVMAGVLRAVVVGLAGCTRDLRQARSVPVEAGPHRASRGGQQLVPCTQRKSG